MTLAVVSTILLVILFALGRVLKLTKTLVKLGCLAVIILIAVTILAVWMLGN